jgi:hypothetical protein
MKKNKFKSIWGGTPRNEIDIKHEIFLALSDKRYLDLLSSNAQADVLDSMSFEQYKFFLKKNKLYKSTEEYGLAIQESIEKRILKKKKEKELKKPRFVPICTNPKTALKQALRLLNAAFTLNKNVKKSAYDTQTCCEHGCDYCGYSGSHTSVDYNLRDSEYAEKSKIIKKVINLIKNNLLPIKYGKNDGIVYFEYLGKQVSFHDPKNQIKNCKKFNGAWTGVPNKKIPFTFVSSIDKF